MKIEQQIALQAALDMRARGLIALPSSDEDKRPTVACTRYRTEPVPEEFYSTGFWRARNIQLLCGAHTSGSMKIAVIDLDGVEAVAAWKKLCRLRNYEFGGTWISVTGSGGKHIYFELPPGTTDCPTRLLWGLWDTLGGPLGNGSWVKHKEIKLLGDTALAVAPPSTHVETGRQYRWLGAFGPHVYDRPAMAPDWLLAMPGVKYPTQIDKQPYRDTRERNCDQSQRDRDKVLAAISPNDKIALSKTWGLRVTGRQVGHWMECHAVDREDENPSAGFDPRTGVYHDNGTKRRLSFYDLGVELGAYTDFDHALASLKKYARIASALL